MLLVSLLLCLALRAGATASTQPSTQHPTPRLLLQKPSPPLLLYIPFHVSENASALQDFADCTFDKHPWQSTINKTKFNVLLAISGLASDGRESELQAILKRAVSRLRPQPHVFVDFVHLQSDRYVAVIDEKRKDADWVGGPNTAFYDAFLDGHIHAKYTKHYAFVQQMETDVCSLQRGWMDHLLDPMTNSNTLVSGARITSDCVYSKGNHHCESVYKLNPDLRLHINGNAMYRIGPELKTALNAAKMAYGNREPFDLALYWMMRDQKWEKRLHANPRFFNVATLVDAGWMMEPEYYGRSISIVHAPRRLRSCPIGAVAIRGRLGMPLTLVVVDGDVPTHVPFQKSFDDNEVSTAFVALNEAAYVSVSKLFPLRVIPAFAKERPDVARILNIDIDDEHAVPSSAVSVKSCTEWLAVDSAAARLVHTVAELLHMGYAPFVVPVNSFAIINYDMALKRLPSSAIYTIRDPPDSLSPASIFNSVTYFPLSERVADATTAWARILLVDKSTSFNAVAERLCGLERTCNQSVGICRLPRDTFAEGGVNVHLSYPLKLDHRAMFAASSHQGGRGSYDMMQAGAMRNNAKLQCANYTMPFRRSISTAAVDFAAVIRKLHAASVFVADHAIDCVVLPSFSHNGASKATMFAVFAFEAVSRAFGNARFAASLRDIDTRNATYVAVSAAHGRKKTDAASNCFNSCDARALHSCPCLDDRLRAILHFARGQLTPKFACSADGGVERKIGTRGVGLTRDILRSKSIKTFATGKWRYATFGDASIFTLTRLRFAFARMHSGARPPLALQELAAADDPIMDDAWSAVVENAICAAANANEVAVFKAPAPHAPIVESEKLSDTLSRPHLATSWRIFWDWLGRPDRPKLQGPFLSMNWHVANLTCLEWARATKDLVILGRAWKMRLVFAPPLRDECWSKLNVKRLHKELPFMMPAMSVAWLQPRLLEGVNLGAGVSSAFAERVVDDLQRQQPGLVPNQASFSNLRARMDNINLWHATANEDVGGVVRSLGNRDWVVLRGTAASLRLLARQWQVKVDAPSAKSITQAFAEHAACCDVPF